MKMELFNRIVLLLIVILNSQAQRQRRKIQTTKCKYTFVVKEMDMSSCPISDEPLKLNGSHRNHGQANSSRAVKFWLNNIEHQLQHELRKSNAKLSKHEISLSKAEKLLSEYETNFTKIFQMLGFLDQTIKKQTDFSSLLDKKLSGVMLDVVEVNNVLSKKQTASNGEIQDKDIEVKSASKINGCPKAQDAVIYRDCAEVQKRHNTSGVYYVIPTFAPCPIPVWCDMDTTLGGWLVLLRRQNGKVNFKRLWDEYKTGFGDIIGEFYLGNDNIFLLTNQKHYELRVDLWDFEGNRVYALYKTFKIDGERDKFKITVHSFEGSAKDALQKHDRMMFSTADNDNDGYRGYNCAKEWEAGWWYNNCWFGFLTGPYYNTSNVRYRGISWNEWKTEQLAKVEMKIRPSRTAPTEKDMT